mmetsp:Transcript_43856/g.42371  ORF Transcript_43856/g.42371 Transcript_43856/m.42371 type:complete len:202 (-) Transcript_43856:2531-3136(-)
MENLLEVSFEFLQAVVSIDVGGEELHVEHVGDELSGGFPADSSPAGHQDAAAWLREGPLREGNHVQNLIEQVHIHLLELPLVGAHGLLDHLDEVRLGDAAQRREVLDDLFAPGAHLADEVGVHELVPELQPALQQRVQDAVVLRLALLVHQSVPEDPRRLIDQHLYQALGLPDVVTQQTEDQLGDVSRRVEVVTVLVHRKL